MQATEATFAAAVTGLIFQQAPGDGVQGIQHLVIALFPARGDQRLKATYIGLLKDELQQKIHIEAFQEFLS